MRANQHGESDGPGFGYDFDPDKEPLTMLLFEIDLAPEVEYSNFPVAEGVSLEAAFMRSGLCNTEEEPLWSAEEMRVWADGLERVAARIRETAAKGHFRHD